MGVIGLSSFSVFLSWRSLSRFLLLASLASSSDSSTLGVKITREVKQRDTTSPCLENFSKKSYLERMESNGSANFSHSSSDNSHMLPAKDDTREKTECKLSLVVMFDFFCFLVFFTLGTSSGKFSVMETISGSTRSKISLADFSFSPLDVLLESAESLE